MTNEDATGAEPASSGDERPALSDPSPADRSRNEEAPNGNPLRGDVLPQSLPSADDFGVVTGVGGPTGDEPSLPERVKTLLVGKPRDLKDQSLFHSVSLIAFLAWVG